MKSSPGSCKSRRLDRCFRGHWKLRTCRTFGLPIGPVAPGFCGKNMTMYGKGVYFARDASYSSSPQYSVPNALGVQHMFLCRVVVGEYCKGVQNALTPAVRDGSLLFDTTVDKMANPSIYVTYNDAQAYPEYLVRFMQ